MQEKSCFYHHCEADFLITLLNLTVKMSATPDFQRAADTATFVEPSQSIPNLLTSLPIPASAFHYWDN